MRRVVGMSGDIHILLVDDEDLLLDVGRMYLEKNPGFIVTTCTSAKEALSLVSSQPVDAIISDYQMPGINGIAFLKELRGKGDKTPFIIFTGKGREEVVIEALNNGADFYLQKGGEPVSQFTELAHKVMHAISRRRNEKNLENTHIQMENIMDLSGIVRWEFDVATRTFSFDERFYSLYGTTAMQEGENQVPVDLYFREFVHPDDAASFARVLAEIPTITDPAFTKQLEQRIIGRDGQVRYITVRFAVIMDDRGKVIRLYGANQDMTAGMEVQRELQNSLSLLTNLVDQSPISIGITDQSGHFIRVNHACSDLLQLTSREMIDKFNILKDESIRAQGFLPLVRDVFLRGTMARFELHYGTLPDGNPLKNQIYEVTVYPVKDLQGAVTNVVIQYSNSTERTIAEETIQQQLAEIVSYYDNAPAGLAVLDTGLHYLRINQRLAELNGLPADEHIGKTVREVVPNVADTVERIAKKILETGQPVIDIEFTGETAAFPDVQRCWREGWHPVRDERGAISWFSVIVEEITGQVLAEEALRLSEERFSLIFEQSPLPITLSHIPDGTYISVNSAFERLVGYRKEEIIGKNSLQLGIIAPGDRKTAMDTLVEDGEIRDREVSIVTKSGYPREVSIVAKVIPFRSERFWLSTLLDITERKQVEDALKRSEEKYRRIIENANEEYRRIMKTVNEGIWEMDENGVITYTNRKMAGMLGYTVEEVVGRTMKSFIHPDDHADNDRHMEVRMKGQTDQYQRRMIRKDGSVIFTSVSATPLLSRNGTFSGSFAMVTDIGTLLAEQKPRKPLKPGFPR